MKPTPEIVFRTVMAAMVPSPDHLLIEALGSGDSYTVAVTTTEGNQSRLIGKHGVRITALKRLAEHMGQGTQEVTLFLREPNAGVHSTGLTIPPSVEALLTILLDGLPCFTGYKLQVADSGAIAIAHIQAPGTVPDELVEAVEALRPAFEKAMNRAITFQFELLTPA